jgi:hypothetical protein
MTLNSVVRKLEALALSHQQINHFFFGEIVEWLANGDLRYPCCFVEINKSEASKDDKQTKFSFDIWFLDLVDIDVLANGNQLDVMSDLTSIAEDFLAMINYTGYQDIWTINTTYDLEYFREKFEDMTIAVRTSVIIGVDNVQDRCAVPADDVIFEPGSPFETITFNQDSVLKYVYVGTASETTTKIIPELINKTLLLVFVGQNLSTPSSLPVPSMQEYYFNAATGSLTLPLELQEQQKLQILYR